MLFSEVPNMSEPNPEFMQQGQGGNLKPVSLGMGGRRGGVCAFFSTVPFFSFSALWEAAQHY